MKKIITAIIISTMAMFCAMSVSAKEMNIYVSGQLLVRDIENVGGFDMLSVEDIAAELGFTTWYDGYNLTLYGTDRTYYFTAGNAVVTDNAGGWYGLDITPREMNGKIRIPAKFFCDALGMTYTWDNITDTLFLNSDYTYNWLINTPEYQQEVQRRQQEAREKEIEERAQLLGGLVYGMYALDDYYHSEYPWLYGLGV